MKTTRRSFLFSAFISLLLLVPVAQAGEKAKGKFLVFVGTYTTQENSKSKGIYAYRFDAATGELSPIGLAAESRNPSFLAVSRDRKFLYAVDEVTNYNGTSSGGIRAFSIDRNSGKLTFLNEVASRGADPCYLSFDKKGKYLLTANYTGGSVAAFPLLRDGRLRDSPWLVQHFGKGSDPQRQEAPHAHSINLSPDNHYAIATDLGLDQVIVYRFGTKAGSLSGGDARIVKTDPGAGPRHFTFHPNGKFAYVVNELSSTVIAYAYDRSGSLRELQKVSMLPADFKGRNDAAEVQVHPSGKFLYASNRGHDSIAVFSINERYGTLALREIVSTRGKEPRNFGIDPTGNYLLAANQNSDSIVVFRINPETGRLKPTGHTVEAPTPVYVKFVALD